MDEGTNKTNPVKELAIKIGIIERPVPDKREIIVGDHEKFRKSWEPFPYPTNKIISSKYTLWNFFPKNLFEQFQRLANFYFGVVTIIVILIDAPVSPVVSIIPLAFVILTSMAKQGYEDWVRHKADSALNNREVKVIKDGFCRPIKCEHIRVGDIVQVDINDEIPADLVFISGSTGAEGTCYVTTANLDGETNLKEFVCHQETACLDSVEQLRSLNVLIECEQPQVDLYKYNGRITIISQRSEQCIKSLSAENLLLRGSSLKNTEKVFGVAIYTGRDTKMALNSKFKPHKVSTVESILNRFLVVMLLVLILEAMFLAVMYFYLMSLDQVEEAWYLVDHTEDVSAGNTINAFLSFSTLINYIVPISLYVTMELQKFMGARFFGWDVEMYDKKTGQYAKANTSDLNEDLGQAEFLFADKTGTLTENDMMFRQCSIEGQMYHEVDAVMKRRSESGTRFVDVDHAEQQILQDFFLKLALCHTVHVNRGVANSKFKVQMRGDREDCIEYQASSPDEKALLEAAFRQRVAFLGLFAGSEMRILLAGREEISYKLHHVLEFDSTRKRMSVVIENSNGELLLLCKGAETAVLNRCLHGPRDTVLHHVNMYAEEGLRTLVIAEKHLSREEFNKIDDCLNKAKTALEGRDELLAAAFDHIETGLTCVGATAVEDQLQDQVPETIEYLRHAGIKVWILTGDKIETARNISYSCRHFKRGMRELSLLYQSNENDCREALEHINTITEEAQDRGEKLAVVVDGQSLAQTLRDSLNRQLFLQISLRCDAVLCCRLSPLQKSEVVMMIRHSPTKPVTLAIGDGANDVSMIQEAHVGIGVMGKEGTQAVRCSDYAIARFKFLQRALLVHGHWYYNRISILVLYFFYKNVAFMNCQALYQFYCAFSSQTLFQSYLLTFFNVLFTSAPILLFGILEQNVPAEKLLKYPSYYKDISRNKMLQWPPFMLWMFYCVWHAAVIYYGVFLVLPNLDNWMFGLAVYHVLIIILNVKLCLHTRLWGTMFIVSLVFTIIGYYLFTCAYSLFFWDFVQETYEFYWLFFDLLGMAELWAVTPLIMVVCFTPDLIAKLVSLIKDRKTPVTWSTAFGRIRKKQVAPGENSQVDPNRDHPNSRGASAGGNPTALNNNDVRQPKYSATSGHSFDNELYLRGGSGSRGRQQSPLSDEYEMDDAGRKTTVLKGSGEPAMQYAKPASGTNSVTSALVNTTSHPDMTTSQRFSMGERASVAPVGGIGDNESAEEHFTAPPRSVIYI
ncbi:phospholipid-transporting ATPase IF-like isoform X5 [Convolutriloba macropyga]|uniref:phospholipid-transporting ATPase IF-like isoform X5 n=1 Tax=Convolutriloba macropyga TaxID=536237 RepID=UPI003F526B39